MTANPTQSHSKRVISATVSTTGEVIEYGYEDTAGLADAYKDVMAHLEAYRQLKSIMLDTSMNLLMRQTDNTKEGKK